MSTFIKLVEVGPRDGLQNEKNTISTDIKIEFINQLSQTGLTSIEIGSFVSPSKVPQMADTLKVAETIKQNPNVSYSALVPNQRGFEDAIKANVDMICLFTAASETFCQKNINCSIEESLERFYPLVDQAKQQSIKVRAYISCCLGCPYEGKISLESVKSLATQLYKMGCDEISLGDTIGVGTANQAKEMIKLLSQEIPIDLLAVHFHDTYGQALANIYATLELGIRIIDSSIAGLGGCPYAPGASGNVATEDVLYMLNGLNCTTGVDLEKLLKTSAYICEKLRCQNHSKVAQARLSMLRS